MGVPGFCGRRPATPVQTTPDDPNADLRGHRFPVDTGGEGTVIGSAPWNPAYVAVDTPAGPTVRVAAQVRRRKELG